MSPLQSKLTEFCIPEVKTKQRTLISNQQRWTYNQSSLNHLQLSTIKILREHHAHFKWTSGHDGTSAWDVLLDHLKLLSRH